MGSQVPCWICDGRGERQIVLRPGGNPDGRTLCRVCIRRLLAWVRRPISGGDGSMLEAVWPRATAVFDIADGEEWREDVRQAIKQRVMEALATEDDAGRARVALAFLETGFVWDALESLATVNPDAVEAELLSDRLLTSLLSRLLARHELAPGAGERLQGLLYPPA
ncbi:MAG: hypothetical protein ACK4N5_18270 [Myxococcales bacterium]